MDRNDLKAIARAFVDLLLEDEALRRETAEALDRPESLAALALIVTDRLALAPPIDAREAEAIEDEMQRIYRELRRRRRFKWAIRYFTGRG